MWDWAKIAAVCGLFFVLAYWREASIEIRPGTPEYNKIIDADVDECVKRSMAEELRKSRLELPILTSRAEWDAECRKAAIESARLYLLSR